MDSRLRGKGNKESTSLVKMISSGCFSRVGGNLFKRKKYIHTATIEGSYPVCLAYGR